MDKELVAHIVEHVKLANGGDGEFEVHSPAAMLRLELRVHDYLMQLGREVIWNLAAEVGSGYQGPRVKRGKVVLRFKGNRPKTVHGLYGPVTVQRAYYASGGGETWVPREKQLGIGGGQTPACEFHLGQFAGHGPYQRSLHHFHTIFRPTGVDQLSLHKTEQLVDALGGRLEQQRQQEIKELFDRDGEVAVSAEITGTMVVCIDAGKAPTKGNERIDDDGRTRYDREFRDVKVASISVLEWDEVQQQARCRNTSYVHTAHSYRPGRPPGEPGARSRPTSAVYASPRRPAPPTPAPRFGTPPPCSVARSCVGFAPRGHQRARPSLLPRCAARSVPTLRRDRRP